MKLGIIEEGKLKGKKVILEPRGELKDNEYLVERGVFFNGSFEYMKACLNRGCEDYISDNSHVCRL